MTVPHSCDPVVIVGGGPAGLAAGITLARQGVRPTLIDRPPRVGPIRRKIGESLAPRAWPILQRLGVEHLIDETRHLPSPGTLSHWGHDGLAANEFIRQPAGRGWHLDRLRFESDLRAVAIEAGVNVIDGTVLKIDRDEAAAWDLQVDGVSQPLRASILIDASGRSCVVGSRVGARRVVFDRLAAWYVFMRSRSPMADARAMIEAVPKGWWYSASLPEGGLVVAMFRDPADLAGQEASSESWSNELTATRFTHRRLVESGYFPLEKLRVAAADSALSEPLAGDGWVACGDAAASFDPLSSHGIATALASGMDAADAVLAMAAGDRSALDRYIDRVRRSFSYFLETRSQVYAQEGRWPESPFWSARRLSLDRTGSN